MGGLFSKNRMEAADINRDGYVTKAELQEYLANGEHTQIEELRQEKLRLQKRFDRLQTAYDELHARQDALLSDRRVSVEPLDASTAPAISNEAIESFVDELIADPEINIYVLPDGIERQMYVNTLKILLNILQRTLNTTEMSLIGHRFKIGLAP
jgi:hypothetical protein